MENFKILEKLKNFLFNDESTIEYGLKEDLSKVKKFLDGKGSISCFGNLYGHDYELIFKHKNKTIEALFYIQLLTLLTYGIYDKDFNFFIDRLNPDNDKRKKLDKIFEFYNSGIINEIINEVDISKSKYFKYVIDNDSKYFYDKISEEGGLGQLEHGGLYFNTYKKALKSIKQDFKLIRFSKKNKTNNKSFKFYDGLYVFNNKNKVLEYLNNSDINGILLCAKHDEEYEYHSDFFYAVKYQGAIYLIDSSQQFLKESSKGRSRSPRRELDRKEADIKLPYGKVFNISDNIGNSKELSIFSNNNDVKYGGSVLDFSEEEKFFNAIVMEEIKNTIINDESIIKDKTTGFMVKNNIVLGNGKEIKFIGNGENKDIDISKVSIGRNNDKQLDENKKWLIECYNEEFGSKELQKSNLSLIPDEFIGDESEILSKLKYEQNDLYLKNMRDRMNEKWNGNDSQIINGDLRDFIYSKITHENILKKKDLFITKDELGDMSISDAINEGKIPLSFSNQYGKIDSPFFDKSMDFIYIDEDKNQDYKKLKENLIDTRFCAWNYELEEKRMKNFFKFFRKSRKNIKYGVIYLPNFRALWNLFGKDEVRKFPFKLKTLRNYVTDINIGNTILDHDIDPLDELTELQRRDYGIAIIFPYQ